jgi:hypothetical protein
MKKVHLKRVFKKVIIHVIINFGQFSQMNVMEQQNIFDLLRGLDKF